MLHITNGDTTVTRLEAAQIPAQIVAWNDVLHEGPVPAARSLEDLREIRALHCPSRPGCIHRCARRFHAA